MAMEQLDRVQSLVSDVLGDAVLGIYLHGSAVFGGLQARSDLDVAAVISRPSTGDQRRELIERLMPMSGRGDPSGRSRSVELTIVVQGEVRPWRYPPPLELMYGDWWRAEYEAGNFAPWESPNPDLALMLSQVLAVDRPLVGPPPGELLDPVPPGDLRRAMLDGMPGLLADLDGDEANVILTLARICSTLETGRIVPKHEAADRILGQLPAEWRPALARARAVYLGELPDVWRGWASQARGLAHLLEERIVARS